MYKILALLFGFFVLSSPADADIKDCGTYPTIYTNQSCARYTNTTPYRVCLYSIEKPSVKRMQYVTGDMICLDPNSEKKLISRYTSTTGIFTYGGKAVEIDILYHPRAENNRYAWFPLSGVKSCIKLSKNSSGYLQEFGGYDYDPADQCSYQSIYAFSGDYLIATQNAAKIDDGTGGGGVIAPPPPEKSDEEKEVDRLKLKIEDVKKISEELRAKIQRCSFDSLQKVLDQDLGVIDYNEVMKTVLNCDDGLNDKVKSAKKEKDELDAIVKQIQKSLREEFLPKNRDRFIVLGAQTTFENDYESLGLNGLYMKNAYVFGVEKNNFFVELAGRYIDDFFNASISQKDEFLFRGTSSAWGESFAFYPDDLLPSNVETDKKIDYAASVFKVRDRLINAEKTFEKNLNRYGYEEDSPVPEEVQAIVLQNIVPRHQNEGKNIENGLKSWKGPLSNHQENLLVSIESLAHLYDASGEDPASDYDTLKRIAKGLGEASVDFARCAVRGGLTDAADWYEIVTGKEWCGDSDITITGRIVSAAGIIAGSSIVWRKAAELAGLSVRVAKKGTKKVLNSAAEIVDSAKKWDSVQSLLHVVKGNYQISADGTRKLVSGMHTKLGFDNFLKLNQSGGKTYSIRNVTEFTSERIEAGGEILSQTLENGVRRVQLPRDAWSNADAFSSASALTAAEGGTRLKGVKTLFPESWDVGKIGEATNDVLNSTLTLRDGNKLVGTFDGVKIQLFIDETGKVLTSFPIWRQ